MASPGPQRAMPADAAEGVADAFEPPFPAPVATAAAPPPSPQPGRTTAAASRAKSRAKSRGSRRATCSTLTHVSVPANAASGFARAPEAYERTRPGYPDAAVAWLCRELGIGPGARVCDLGAGTGKLTRLLVTSGAELVAIEPLAEMRAELARALPQVDVRPGRGEALPFEDASLDAIVVAQAFHWFDAPAALDEAARVLRDGGALGLVWYVWELDDPLMARLDALVQQHAPPDRDEHGVRPVPYTSRAHAAARWRDAFPHPALEEPRQLELPWSQLLPAGDLVDRIRSVSVIGALPDDRREAALAETRRLADGLGDEVELAYRTAVYAWRRRAR